MARKRKQKRDDGTHDVVTTHSSRPLPKHVSGHDIDKQKCDDGGVGAIEDIDISSHLPSRQLAEDILTDKGFIRKSIKQRVTMHHSGHLPDNEVLAERIANVLADDMKDEPQANNAAAEILRDMTGTTLSMKKKIRRRVQSFTMRKESVIPTWFQTKKYELFMRWQHVRYHLNDITSYFTLWKSSVKVIEGQFGTSVTSYFRFLRWLFFLNIPIFLLSLFFIILPDVFYRTFSSEHFNQLNNTFYFKDIFLGTGYFTDTEMYYGFYTDVVIQIVPNLKYNMKYAYLFTSGGYYLLCLILLAYSMAKSYRQVYVRGHYEMGIRLTERVFCGWQNGIMSPEAARLHHRSMYNELKEYLSMLTKPAEHKQIAELVKLWSLRLSTNLFIVGMIAGCAYLVHFMSNLKLESKDTAFWHHMGMPLSVSALLFVFPYAFTFIGTYEKYEKPSTKLYVGMVRTMLQKASVLVVLIYYWFNTLPCQQPSSTNSTQLTGPTENDKHCKLCWETEMAQQIYKLVIVDFLFIVFSTFFLEFIASHAQRLYTKKPSNIHFNIGRNTLDIIFSQVLIWFVLLSSLVIHNDNQALHHILHQTDKCVNEPKAIRQTVEGVACTDHLYCFPLLFLCYFSRVDGLLHHIHQTRFLRTISWQKDRVFSGHGTHSILEGAPTLVARRHWFHLISWICGCRVCLSVHRELFCLDYQERTQGNGDFIENTAHYGGKR